MNTIKTSISAIIFVILYFLLILFISMFKGLHFYDLKLSNIKIKHLFIKLENKLILKADNIIILPSNYQTDITNLHKKFYYVFNISKIFKTLEFDNIKYNSFNIKSFIFKKNKIIIKSNIISLNGAVIPKTNFSTFFINSLKINNYEIKDLVGTINYQNNIKLNSEFRFQDFKYKLNANLHNNILKGNLLSKTSQINYQKILIKNKDLNTTFTYNLTTKHYKAKIYTTDTKIYKNKTIIFTKQPKLKITNKKIVFNLTTTNLNDPKLKLYIKDANGTYFFNSYLFARLNHSKITYNNITTKISFLDITYKNLKNLNAVAKNIEVLNKFKAKTKFCRAIIFGKYRFVKCNNEFFKYDMLNLMTNTIELINNELKTKQIKGKYKNIPLNFNDITLNTKKKELQIKEIFIDKIRIYDVFANTKDFVTYNASFKTNATLNNNLKQILKQFNINLPITQIRGKNDIFAKISYNKDNKDFDINTTIKSKNPAIKYQDIIVSSSSVNANYFYKKQSANFNVKNLNVTHEPIFLKTSFKGNFFQNKYLNIFSYINEFKLLNLLHITNFKEKIAVDLQRKIFYLINLAIMGDYGNNRFYFYSFKPVIKYTPFSGIINNGSAVVNIYKNSVKMLLTLFLNKPLILNNKPQPKSLFAIMDIDKHNLIIHNNYAYVLLKDYQKLDATINNAEINVNMVIDIIHTVTPLIPTSKKPKKTKPFVAKVIGNNTNFIYNKHKFLSEKFTITYNKELYLTSKYKNSKLEGYTKHKYFLLSGTNYTKTELVPLLDFFDHFLSVNLDFVLVKSPEDFYTGKVYINHGIVKDLKALNNIIAFLNTIPSLLSLKSPGFSAKGYKIRNGFVDYLYYKNILYFKKIKINGVNIDFDGKGYIDFNTNTISLKITSYLKLNIKKIPIIGKGLSYLLLGKDGSITVKIVVSGPLDDPKVSQDIGKSIILSPFELFKRVLTLPFHLF